MESLILFIRLSRPLFLLGAALLYALGVGIARYLGVQVVWGTYILGQVWVTLLQLFTHYINEFFDAPADRDHMNRTPFSGGSGVVGPGKLSPRIPLMAALTCLAILASTTVILISLSLLTPETYLIMGLAFVGSFFYSAPPLQLKKSGYGEITTSLMVAFLLPMYAFILQSGELHRLVAMSTFPLSALHLAMILAFEFPDYAVDLKHDSRTLLVRMGWSRTMVLHNVSILSSYLLLGIAALFGLPNFVVLAALLSLPLGVFQIWQMRRIADGSKPNWILLTLGALALFGSMAYFMALAYWTH